MKSLSTATALASLVSTVAAHGYVTSPQPRLPGPGLEAACGQAVYNNQNADHFGNVQGSIQNLQGSQPNCRIWQCKGIPFADHAQIYNYQAGQVIPMTVDIRAPHSGVANVSIVKTSTDKIIGQPLKSWAQYALTSSPLSDNPDWTAFSITMPDVSSECGTAGDCVIQWWWDAPSINQSYEACIDFTMGGGSGSGSSSTNSTTPTLPQPSQPAMPTSPLATPTASSIASPQTSKPATQTSPSATPNASKAASPQPSSSGSSYPAEPQPSSTPGQTGSSTMPKTFTMDTFIAWLRANAGSDTSNKVRRTTTVERAHARAFAT